MSLLALMYTMRYQIMSLAFLKDQEHAVGGRSQHESAAPERAVGKGRVPQSRIAAPSIPGDIVGQT